MKVSLGALFSTLTAKKRVQTFLYEIAMSGTNVFVRDGNVRDHLNLARVAASITSCCLHTVSPTVSLPVVLRVLCLPLSWCYRSFSQHSVVTLLPITGLSSCSLYSYFHLNYSALFSCESILALMMFNLNLLWLRPQLSSRETTQCVVDISHMHHGSARILWHEVVLMTLMSQAIVMFVSIYHV